MAETRVVPPVAGAVAEPRSYGPVTRTDIVRYAGASGDFNPIHHDEPFAVESGFPSVFSIGMYQAGVLAGFATDWLGADNVRRFAVRFREQVWPGDVLTCTGQVVSVEPGPGGSVVDVELNCVREGVGDILIAGSANFLIPS